MKKDSDGYYAGDGLDTYLAPACRSKAYTVKSGGHSGCVWRPFILKTHQTLSECVAVRRWRDETKGTMPRECSQVFLEVKTRSVTLLLVKVLVYSWYRNAVCRFVITSSLVVHVECFAAGLIFMITYALMALFVRSGALKLILIIMKPKWLSPCFIFHDSLLVPVALSWAVSPRHTGMTPAGIPRLYNNVVTRGIVK